MQINCRDWQAGIASQQSPEQLVIALEPEAASIYIRKLRMSQLVPQRPTTRRLLPSSGESSANTAEQSTSTDLVAEGIGPGLGFITGHIRNTVFASSLTREWIS